MNRVLPVGTVGRNVTVALRSATTGQLVTGKVYGDVTYSYWRDGAAAGGTGTAITATKGTWASAGFVETDYAGMYQFGIPNACLAAGADGCKIKLSASGCIDAVVDVQLTSATRGLSGTALPDYTPGKPGGLSLTPLPVDERRAPRLVTKNVAANPTLVKVCPYDVATNPGTPNGLTDPGRRSFLNYGHKYRFAKTGIVSQARIYSFNGAAADADWTELYLTIWRKIGSNYCLAAETENLRSQVNNGTSGTITLTFVPLEVQEGDYYGIRLVNSGAVNYWGAIKLSTGCNLYYVTDATPSPIGYDWESGLKLSGYTWPIEFDGPAPGMVVIGDSIAAGHPDNYSFIEADDYTVAGLSPAAILGKALNLSAMNMGIGSQTTTSIAARFAADCVAKLPKIAVINGGVNDIAGGSITESTFIANWTAMLDAATAAGILPVVCEIMPWTNGTTEQMQTRDTWNAALTALCAASYPSAIVVDFDDTMGVFRTGGDTDNKWDLQTAYDDDGVHPTALGYVRWCETVLDAIAARGVTLTSAYNAAKTAAQASSWTPELATQLGTNVDAKVSEAGGGTGSGTGARTVTITVNDGTTVLEGVRVRVTNGVETYLVPTTVAGVALFSLDDLTWVIALSRPGYAFTPTTLAVSSDVSQTYSMTAAVIPASDVSRVSGFAYCYDESGVAESDVVVQLKMKSYSGYGGIHDTKIRPEASSVDGLVSFTNLIPGAAYQYRRGTEGNWEEFTIPTTATSPYAMPDLLGEED